MRGVVTCPQPRAAEAGARVLERGGNAFDAAIAAAFVQMVVDPFMCGPGGLGTAHVYVAATREHAVIDFPTLGGANVRPDMWVRDLRGHTAISHYSIFADDRSERGYTSIMTPGTVAGLAELHQRHATLPLPELLAPAIAMARDGWRATPGFAGWLRGKPQPGLPDGLTRIRTTAECARIYLKEGRLFEEGELVRNPDLARTFERLVADGPDDFYRGGLAAEIARDLQVHGSYVMAADLAAYQVRNVPPVTATYRGCTVAVAPPPGAGAGVLEILNILEGFELGRLHHGGPDHLHLLASAMRAAFADRARFLGDPAFGPVPVAGVFTSKEHAARLRDAIRGGALASPAPNPDRGTTHLNVLDAAGNVVSVSHTLGTASGVVTPGLGFIYNNSMKLFEAQPGHPNSMAAGKARVTGVCPAIVFHDGAPWFAVGAPGGAVIMSAVAQAISNVIDFGMTATEAVSAPRIHCEGPTVYAEARIREDVVAALERRGHQVEHLVSSYGTDMSRAQVAMFREGGFDAGSDPRNDGGGVAYAVT